MALHNAEVNPNGTSMLCYADAPQEYTLWNLLDGRVVSEYAPDMIPKKPRRYFSARTATDAEARGLDLDTLNSLFSYAYDHFWSSGYFAEAFGQSCTDGDIEGAIGPNVEAYVTSTVMKTNLWPIKNRLHSYSEADLFDLIEFLFDHVSKPQQKDFHSWNDCGYHFSDFSSALGQEEFRERLNPLLERYAPGYELNAHGELMEVSPEGLGRLLSAQLPSSDATVSDKVKSAVARFRRYGSSITERHQAVRDLAEVLEWLRPQIKIALLKKDEQELFQLANNFGIRHFRQDQKLEYDRAVWLSWMFYHYLATIHASEHLLKRQGGAPQPRRV